MYCLHLLRHLELVEHVGIELILRLVVQADDAGQVRLYAGLPYTLLGISLMDDGRPLGVPARVVRTEDAPALDHGILGEGEAVALATRLIWRYGIPQQWKVPRTGGTG